jgi:hypothetical protein
VPRKGLNRLLADVGIFCQSRNERVPHVVRPAVANKGPKGYAGADGHTGPGILKDFARAAEESIWNPEQLRKTVRDWLATAVIEGRPSNVSREAELIGKMEDVTYLCETRIYRLVIFAALVEPEGATGLESALATRRCIF